MVKTLTRFLDYIIDKTANKCETPRFHIFSNMNFKIEQSRLWRSLYHTSSLLPITFYFKFLFISVSDK